MRLAVSLLAAVAMACGSTGQADRLHNIEKRVDSFEEDLADTEAVVAQLSAAWEEVRAAYSDAARAYREARTAYDRAAHSHRATSAQYTTAARSWEAARARWKAFQVIVEVAFAIDQMRYQDPRGAFDCAPMTTTAFRTMLSAKGINITGKDVDHIVPRSLGGADHPSNYQLLDASTNRSLGARWDFEKCAMAGHRRCGEAIAVSKRCGGYRGPWF